MSDPHTSPAPQDDNQLIAERREKLKALREAQRLGKGVAFPNDFKPGHHAADLQAHHGAKTAEALLEEGIAVSIAGRMMLKRVMGKASFATLQDATGRFQIYVTRDDVGEEVYASFKHWDLGDIVAAEGKLFKTRTGELSVHASRVRLLTKSLRPMPDKFHGMADQEVKYRQRYVDLMTDQAARDRFAARSKAVSGIREFMVAHNFLEVETPMLHPIPGGANAKPFTTHHNALDQQMFLRIAPELYLKRLLVGGFERVFEINRNFRNEGLDKQHNPEFTMLEAYQAYGDYETMMETVESLIKHVAQKVLGTLVIEHKNAEGLVYKTIDLTNWRRARYKDLVREKAGADWFAVSPEERRRRAIDDLKLAGDIAAGYEDFEVTGAVFEKLVEPTLIQPTFVTHLPKELVPLAKRTPDDPTTVEVFECCINGQEISPGYTEQNDPIVQRETLEHQAGGEQQKLDEDFLVALEHGMPPAGGIGIGIDRLCMMLLGQESIRDVILFPQMKPR